LTGLDGHGSEQARDSERGTDREINASGDDDERHAKGDDVNDGSLASDA
jgi:hypothetical protein